MNPQMIINALLVHLAETTVERDDARRRLAEVVPKLDALERTVAEMQSDHAVTPPKARRGPRAVSK